MHIYYEDGPPSIGMGDAGAFKRGVSRDIDDKLAQQILKKTSIVFKEGQRDEQPKAADPGKESDAGKDLELGKELAGSTSGGKRAKEVNNGSN